MRDRIFKDITQHTCQRVATAIQDGNGLLEDPHDAVHLSLDVFVFLFSTLIGTLAAHSPPEERDTAAFERSILDVLERYSRSKAHKHLLDGVLAAARVRDIMRSGK